MDCDFVRTPASYGPGQGQNVDSRGAVFEQRFVFYQVHDVESTVIDTRAGDDEVHADPGYTFPGLNSEWGIKPRDFEQRATIAGSLDHGDALVADQLGEPVLLVVLVERGAALVRDAGEQVGRRERRVRFRIPLHLRHLEHRLPLHPRARVLRSDRPAFAIDLVEHHAVRDVRVVRNGDEPRAGLLIGFLEPSPEVFGLRAVEAVEGDVFPRGLAVGRDDHAV